MWWPSRAGHHKGRGQVRPRSRFLRTLSLVRRCVNAVPRAPQEAVVCKTPSWRGPACAATVSPEVGIERSSEHSHLSTVIRKAGLEWAARREDGQGAIHSPFLEHHPATADTSPASLRSGHTICSLGPRPESISTTAPDAVAPCAAELPRELSATQPAGNRATRAAQRADEPRVRVVSRRLLRVRHPALKDLRQRDGAGAISEAVV